MHEKLVDNRNLNFHSIKTPLPGNNTVGNLKLSWSEAISKKSIKLLRFPFRPRSATSHNIPTVKPSCIKINVYDPARGLCATQICLFINYPRCNGERKRNSHNLCAVKSNLHQTVGYRLRWQWKAQVHGDCFSTIANGYIILFQSRYGKAGHGKVRFSLKG